MNITLKELHKLIDIGHRCDNCIHFNGTAEAFNKIHYRCKLSNTLMPNNYACGIYNKDISNEKVCYNCSHFLGGGDWGLSCSADYYMLTNALNDKCDRIK